MSLEAYQNCHFWAILAPSTLSHKWTVQFGELKFGETSYISLYLSKLLLEMGVKKKLVPYWIAINLCINLNVQCRILLLWPQHGSGKITSKMHRHEIAILLYQKNACPLEQMGPMVKVLGILWRRDKDQDEKMQTSTKRSKKSQLYCGMRWRERSSKVRCFLFSFSILKQRNIREPVGNFRPPKGAKKTWSKMA